MSAKTKEIKALVKEAREQGWIDLGFDGAGHQQLKSPDGKKVSIPSTPRTDQAVRNARAKLVRMGMKKPGHREPRIEEEGRDDSVPSFGELARVGPEKETTPAATTLVKHHGSDLMPVHEILSKLPLAGWLVWQTIVDEIQSSPDQYHVVTLKGKAGYQWKGSRNQMISKVWPGLSGVDYSKQPWEMPEERRKVNTYLTVSRNMAVLKPGSKHETTTWWVALEWTNADPQKVMHSTGNWWEDRVTPEEAGENREAAPVTSMFKCSGCPFTTASSESLRVHERKTAETGEHPQEHLQCPIPGCVEVRTTAARLGSHLSRQHPDVRIYICHKCRPIMFFSLESDRRRHSNEVHSVARARAENRALTGIVPEAPRTESLNGRVIEPVTAPKLNSGDPLTAMQEVIEELTTLRLKVGVIPQLQEMIDAQNVEIADLREQLKAAEGTPGLEEELAEAKAEIEKLTIKYDKLKVMWMRLAEDV